MIIFNFDFVLWNYVMFLSIFKFFILLSFFEFEFKLLVFVFFCDLLDLFFVISEISCDMIFLLFVGFIGICLLFIIKERILFYRLIVCMIIVWFCLVFFVMI